MALSNNASIKEVMDTFEQINNKIIDRGGARTVTPSTSNQVLAKGNYKGDITIVGDSDLKAENIKSAVNIFGVVGTLKVIDNLPDWVNDNNIVLGGPKYPTKECSSYGTWTSPTQNKLWTIGGSTNNNSWQYNQYYYNLASNSWGTSAQIPKTIRSSILAEVAGNMYSIGGGGAQGSYAYDQVKEYNMSLNFSTNTWTNRANLPRARYRGVVCSVGSNLYIQGGRSGNTSSPIVVEDYIYNTSAGTYTTIPKKSADNTYYGIEQFSVNHKDTTIYIPYDTSATHSFNIASKTWTDKVGCPESLRHTLAIRGDNIYVATKNGIYKYNILSNSWSKTSSNVTYICGMAFSSNWLYYEGDYNKLGSLSKMIL